MANEPMIERIRRNPKFHELARRRARFTWTLFAIAMILYYCLIITVAFRPDWLRIPLANGAMTTVGWPAGAAVIVLTWLLAGIYVRRANSEFEALKDEILGEEAR
jgi:uncharacterized membrane protein (DUF485 family)